MKIKRIITPLLFVAAVVALSVNSFGDRPASSGSGDRVKPYSYEELQELTGWEMRHEPVLLSQMNMEQPDMADMEAQAKALMDELEQAAALTEAFDIMMQAKRLFDAYDNYYVLCEFYHDWNQSDEEALERLQFCDESYARTEEWWGEFYDLIEASPYRSTLLPIWNPSENASYQHSYNSYRTDKLWEQIDEISAAAEEILDYGTVSLHGSEMDLGDCYAEADWEAACGAWLDVHGAALLEQYTALVEARSALARDGYRTDSFAHYIFTEYGWEYTPQMVANLVEDIVEHLLPLDDTLTELGYWDALYGDYSDKDSFVDSARPVLRQMDEEMAAAFDLLLDYELWESERTDYTVSRPYANYLPLHRVAVVLCPYYDDVMSVMDITHEFGHFYEYYLTMDAYSRQMDLSEVHSQAMTLLFCEEYSRYYEDASMSELALVDLVDTLVYQSFNASVELAVYDLPEGKINEANILRIGKEAYARFGYDHAPQSLRDYYWLLDSELFNAPFEAFSYVVSAGVALEIWEEAQEDMSEAIRKYKLLVNHKNTEEFLYNLRWAQLQSPFEEGFAEEAAQLLSERLLESDAAA